MSNNNSEIIEREFSEVLQTTGLMWLEPADKDDECEADTGEQMILATISYKGPRQGRVRLATSLAMSAELSANMLGIDANDPAAQTGAEDALKELLNVTCGRLLTAGYGEEPVFDLAPPMVRNCEPDELREFKDQPDTRAFMADDFPVWVNWEQSA